MAKPKSKSSKEFDSFEQEGIDEVKTKQKRGLDSLSAAGQRRYMVEVGKWVVEEILAKLTPDSVLVGLDLSRNSTGYASAKFKDLEDLVNDNFKDPVKVRSCIGLTSIRPSKQETVRAKTYLISNSLRALLLRDNPILLMYEAVTVGKSMESYKALAQVQAMLYGSAPKESYIGSPYTLQIKKVSCGKGDFTLTKDQVAEGLNVNFNSLATNAAPSNDDEIDALCALLISYWTLRFVAENKDFFLSSPTDKEILDFTKPYRQTAGQKALTVRTPDQWMRELAFAQLSSVALMQENNRELSTKTIAAIRGSEKADRTGEAAVGD